MGSSAPKAAPPRLGLPWGEQTPQPGRQRGGPETLTSPSPTPAHHPAKRSRGFRGGVPNLTEVAVRLGGCGGRRCFPVSSSRDDESSDGGLPRKAGVGKGRPCPDCPPSPRSLPRGALPPGRRAPGCPGALCPCSKGPVARLSRPIIRVLRRRRRRGERAKIDGRTGGEGASGVPAPHLLGRVFSRLRSGPVGLPGTLQGPAGLFKAEAAEGGGEGEGGQAPRRAPPRLWLPEAGEEATLPSAGRCTAAFLSSPDGPPKGYDPALQQPLPGGGGRRARSAL